MISICFEVERLLFKFFDGLGEKMSHLILRRPDDGARNSLISCGKYFVTPSGHLGIIVAVMKGNKRIYSSYANCKRQLVFF